MSILREAGYDIVYPFLTSFSLAKEFKSDGLKAVMVCNTKALWRKFSKLICSNKDFVLMRDPLDRIVENDISRLFPQSDKYCVLYTHRMYGGKFFPFQKVAHEIGLAYFDPISHLSIHPLYGPWFSMRAIVVFNHNNKNIITDVTSCKPASKPSTLDEEILQQIVPTGSKYNNWKEWLKVRDTVSQMVGSNSFRFSDDQILYHYTKDLRILYGDRI